MRPSCGTSLLLDDGAVGAADFAPSAVEALELFAFEGAEGVFGRGFFVDLDAPAGAVFDPPVAVLDLRAAAEDLFGAVVRRGAFLDAEVGGDQVEREVAHDADGREVAGTVPGGADAEELGHGGDLANGRQAASLRDVDADEIDEALGDERGPLVRAVEEFAHGELRGALLADHAEIRDVFGREGVFEEEQAERLDFFGEADGLDGRDAFVYIVE